jgi:hypothetical protein
MSLATRSSSSSHWTRPTQQDVDRITGVDAVVRKRALECRREKWLDFVWNTRQYGPRLALRWLRQNDGERRVHSHHH